MDFYETLKSGAFCGGGGSGGGGDNLYKGDLEAGGINRSTGALDDTDINAVRSKNFTELEAGNYVCLWYNQYPSDMLYTWVEIYDESGNFVRSFDTYGATQPPFAFTLTAKSKVKFLWKRYQSTSYPIYDNTVTNIYVGLVPS